MFGPTRDTNGRTGIQKLLSGIGAALAVLVVASMLAAPASATGEKMRIPAQSVADGEDVVLEGAAAGGELVKATSVADGEDVVLEGWARGRGERVNQAVGGGEDVVLEMPGEGNVQISDVSGDCSGDLDGVETCDVTVPAVIVHM